MTQIERESMEVDVLYVGAGPATLASAIHLMNQVEAWNRAAEQGGRQPIEPPTVLVLEKSASVGDHMLSGGVMNPRSIAELVPDFEQQGFPTEYVCNYAGFWIFHPKGKLAVPSLATPPNFRKKGYHVVSLNKVAKWMAERAEAADVQIYPGFAGDQLLIEGTRVVGVRTGDMGVDKEGKPKGTFQPGMDIFAKVTVLGEGVRGSLAKQLIDRFDLQGMNPADLRDRDQGDLAHQPEEAPARPGRARNELPEDPRRVPRHVALRHAGQPRLLRLRHDARLRESEHRSAPRGPALQDQSLDEVAARGRRARALRREDDPDRGPLRAAEALPRRRDAGR